MPKENPEFLQKKYSDLPGSKPVEKAVQKARREGEPIPDKKLARIQTYLDRLEKIVDSENGWQHLKHKLVKEFTIDTTDEDTMNKVAYALYQSEKKRAREQGRTEELQELEQQSKPEILQSRKTLIKEKQVHQEQTLQGWFNYLQENDAQYPMWFRYYAVRNLSKMGAIDKEKGEYAKRTKETTAPFPKIHPAALGYVFEKLKSGIGDREFTEPEDQEKRAQLVALIEQADFPKLYIFAQRETAGQLNKESIEGQWVKYNQKSDHRLLEQSLKGKGTDWCTENGSAHSQLQGGDFYVYYTKGLKGGYTEPRIAIRMANGQVAEVRGVNDNQELEPALLDIAQAQYQTLPGGEKYDKKASDMKQLTAIEKKMKAGEKLAKNELLFLYETDSKIESFGYQDDPRIKELRSQRNPAEDMLIIFECAKEQIAHHPQEINGNTKAYVGPLEPGIFTKLQEYNIEHIYTSFPEGRIRKETVPIGGQAKKELIQTLEEQKAQGKLNISDYAMDLLNSKDFAVLKETEEAVLIRLTVSAFFTDNQSHTTQEIFQRAEELGLELCPPEVGPRYRLQYQDQPLNEWLYIGMKQISVRDGRPGVFELGRDGGGLWLDSDWADPDDTWDPRSHFVFRLRKFTKET